MMLSLRKVYTV